MIYSVCFFYQACIAFIKTKRLSLIDIVLLVLAILSAFVAFVVFKINLSKKAYKSRKQIGILGKASKQWNYDEICDRAKDVFFAFHAMLSSGDISFIDDYVTDVFYVELKKRYYLAAVKQRAKGNIKLKEIIPVEISDYGDDTRDCVLVYINGESTNCGIDAEIDSKLSESINRTAKHGEYWQFVRDKEKWMLNKIIYR